MSNQENISENFLFLSGSAPDLAIIATFAEKYYMSDPNGSIIQSRRFADVCAKYVAATCGIYQETNRSVFFDRIRQLKQKGIIQNKIYYIFDNIRVDGNKVAHPHPENITGVNTEQISSKKALQCVKKIHKLAIWYYSSFCNKSPVKIPPYRIIDGSINNIEKATKEELVTQEKKIEEELEFTLIRLNDESLQNPKLIEQEINQAKIIENATFIGDINDNNELLVIKNRYQIINPLSSGSFGETYLAEDLDMPDKPFCVVKKFRPQSTNNDTAIRLFNQEAEVLRKLGNHPDIPTLYASFKDEQSNELYLVQEYISGNTLREEIIRSEKWDESKVIDLLIKILTPLEEVHKQNIVHRDIKPENLIRRAENKNIVLIDFGAVKQIVSDQEQGTIIGTANYMPSEQMRGKINLGCDIYAVGLIAIEALTGKSVRDLCNTNSGQLNWLDQADHINSKLKNILRKMTAYNYTERYANATEAIAALKENPTEPPKPPLPIIFTCLGIAGIILILAYYFLFQNACKVATEKRIWGTCYKDLATSPLIIGVTTNPDKYDSLAAYLKDKLGNSVQEVIIDKAEVDDSSRSPYQSSKDRIASAKWDIAYTYSPTNSIIAVDRGYKWVGKMFPGYPDYYQSVLFVKKNSPIKSPDEIKSSTIIALGQFGSASTFYLPAYLLYGRSLSVIRPSKGKGIIDLVKSGKADIGVATINKVKSDPQLRIISQSQDIPGAGVFISPKLTSDDQDKIKQLLLNAPKKIISQDQANGPGIAKELNYEYFRKIALRAEEVLKCSDFSHNPVQFFCDPSKNRSNKGIIGKLISWETLPNTDINFTLKSQNAQLYSVIISPNIMSLISGCTTPLGCNGKTVQITNVQPKSSGKGDPELRIQDPSQLIILKNQK